MFILLKNKPRKQRNALLCNAVLLKTPLQQLSKYSITIYYVEHFTDVNYILLYEQIGLAIFSCVWLNLPL